MCFQLNKVIPHNSNKAWDNSHTHKYPVLDSGPTKKDALPRSAEKDQKASL